ncbi:Os12g0440300, partial [Oryza sativa Japonica Group]
FHFSLSRSLHLEINRHHHVLLSAGLRSCYRRSGHLPLSLRLPPLSPGARCSETPSPTGVPTSRPPESRHLARSPFYFLSAAREKKRRGRRNI